MLLFAWPVSGIVSQGPLLMSYGVGLACGPLYDLKLSQVLDFGYNAFSRSCMNFGACTFKATKKCGP